MTISANFSNIRFSSHLSAAIERVDWERRNSSPKVKSPTGHKSRGLLRILGKLRRSNSAGLDKDVVPFTRGGIRSTAAPRLGWMGADEPLRRYLNDLCKELTG